MTEDKYPRAIKRMHSLLSGLLELSQMLSIMLYNDFGLPRHPKDDYIDEYTAQGDASLVMNRIEDDIKALDRYRTLTKPRAKDDSSSKIRGADK